MWDFPLKNKWFSSHDVFLGASVYPGSISGFWWAVRNRRFPITTHLTTLNFWAPRLGGVLLGFVWLLWACFIESVIFRAFNCIWGRGKPLSDVCPTPFLLGARCIFYAPFCQTRPKAGVCPQWALNSFMPDSVLTQRPSCFLCIVLPDTAKIVYSLSVSLEQFHARLRFIAASTSFSAYAAPSTRHATYLRQWISSTNLMVIFRFS